MKRFLKLISVFAIAIFFFSCSSEDVFTANDWIGNWKVEGNPVPVLNKASGFTKGAQGIISVDINNTDNGLVIKGSLFGMSDYAIIKGTLSPDCTSVRFFGSDYGTDISGTAKMAKKNEIEVTYTKNDGADEETFMFTAVRF